MRLAAGELPPPGNFLRYGTKLIDVAIDLQGRAPENGRFDPPWTTLNIGRIAGGHIHNVIPENCSMDWEFRPVQDADFAYVKNTIETLRKWCQRDRREPRTSSGPIRICGRLYHNGKCGSKKLKGKVKYC